MMGIARMADTPIRTSITPNHPRSFFLESMKVAMTRLPMPMHNRKAVRIVVKAWVELSRKKTRARVQNTSNAKAQKPEIPMAHSARRTVF